MKEDNLTSILADLAESAAPSDQIDLWPRVKKSLETSTWRNHQRVNPGEPNLKAAFDSQPTPAARRAGAAGDGDRPGRPARQRRGPGDRPENIPVLRGDRGNLLPAANRPGVRRPQHRYPGAGGDPAARAGCNPGPTSAQPAGECRLRDACLAERLFLPGAGGGSPGGFRP